MQKVDILNTPVFTSSPEDNVLFCDFGKHAFAVLEIEAECDTATDVILSVGEVLENGRINRAPGGSRIYQEQTVSLSSGKNLVKMEMFHAGYNNGTLTLTPNAVPFRYAEVRGKVKQLKVGIKKTGNDFMNTVNTHRVIDYCAADKSYEEVQKTDIPAACVADDVFSGYRCLCR